MLENQDVQRLEGDVNSQIILPRVLGDLIVHDEKLLVQRESLLKSGNYRGNTKKLKAYKAGLPKLSPVQIEVCVGLLLGDTTLQASHSGKDYRLKTQQAVENLSLLEEKQYALLPWILTGVTKPSKRAMQELQTISHPAFKQLVDILQDPAKQIQSNECMQKKIPANIEEYLSPVAIGMWFCGDGGRRDYGLNEGKAIQFHTQGFSAECSEHLANALANRYGWVTKSKFDFQSPNGTKRYIVQIEAASFESFVEIVDPYILPCFKKRLPAPRKPGSRYKPS